MENNHRWKAEWTIVGLEDEWSRRTTHKFFLTELDAFNYLSTVHDHLAFLGLKDLLLDDTLTLEVDGVAQ